MNDHDELARRARHHLEQSASVTGEVSRHCLSAILSAARMLSECFRSGGRVYLCGNGGSAADCQHMAAEFVSRLTREFERPGLPAVALTTDTSFLTAYGNDVGFDGIFERQIQVLGRAGDVLIAISTSGSSANVLKAVQAARVLGIHTIALTGPQGRLGELADVTIAIPSTGTQHVQESHLAVEHVLCDLVEQSLFGPGEHPGNRP